MVAERAKGRKGKLPVLLGKNSWGARQHPHLGTVNGIRVIGALHRMRTSCIRYPSNPLLRCSYNKNYSRPEIALHYFFWDRGDDLVPLPLASIEREL